MTLRQLLDSLNAFANDNPNHESLDQQVVVRLQINQDHDDELHVGGLRELSIDSGCTETFTLVLDADQEPDEPDEVE